MVPIQSPVNKKKTKKKQNKNHCLPWSLLVPLDSRVSVQAHLSAELFQLSLPSYKKFHLSLQLILCFFFPPTQLLPEKKLLSLSLSPNCVTLWSAHSCTPLRLLGTNNNKCSAQVIHGRGFHCTGTRDCFDCFSLPSSFCFSVDVSLQI